MTYEARYRQYEPVTYTARVAYRVAEYWVPEYLASSRGAGASSYRVSYLVDVRLREFRRVTRDGVVVIPFDSVEGKVLLFLLSLAGRP